MTPPPVTSIAEPMRPLSPAEDSKINRDILAVMENYRLAVERKDAAALMLMASENYREDGGTVSGKDDYGYDKLRAVLTGRFQKGSDLRYSLRGEAMSESM